jgi:SAM-dependent methyltransferase
MSALEYERFADIYRVWTATAGSTHANHPFYVEAYLAAGGPVVELGVGDGRIAVDAAVRGCHVVGVDLSPAMLALCRDRAAAAGVRDRLTLLQGDFPQLRLRTSALIALPYHSLGHLTRSTRSEACATSTRSCGRGPVRLRRLPDDARSARPHAARAARAEYDTPDGQHAALGHVAHRRSAQTMRVVT